MNENGLRFMRWVFAVGGVACFGLAVLAFLAAGAPPAIAIAACGLVSLAAARELRRAT